MKSDLSKYFSFLNQLIVSYYTLLLLKHGELDLDRSVLDPLTLHFAAIKTGTLNFLQIVPCELTLHFAAIKTLKYNFNRAMNNLLTLHFAAIKTSNIRKENFMENN